MDKKDLIYTRDYVEDDHNFIMSTWLKGLKYGNDFFRDIQSKPYFETYHRALSGLIGRPDITIKVSCLKEDPSVILGYSVAHGAVLDWVYVKDDWRRIGIASSLIPPGVSTVSHWTKLGKKIMPKTWIINPFS